MQKGRKGEGGGGGCYSLDAKASGLEGRWGVEDLLPSQPTYLPALRCRFLVSFSPSLHLSPWAASGFVHPGAATVSSLRTLEAGCFIAGHRGGEVAARAEQKIE